MSRCYYGLSFLIICFMSGHSSANETITTVIKNLGVPWGMAWFDTQTLLVTERQGVLSKLNVITGKKTPISGLPTDIKHGGQGGLFDIALPPHNTAGWLYLSYSKNVDGQGVTTLSRAKLTGHRLIEWQDLLVSQSASDTSAHYGGRIAFDNDGHVFMSIGERGVRSNAQDLSNHAGTIIRLNLDGTVPEDNPFQDKKDALAEIWSYGHRNPQGLFFNPDNLQLWEVEHGPRGGDEINLIKAGHNYGWPEISYGKEYYLPVAVGNGTERAGMEQPIKTYIPSIAPSSLIQYRHSVFSGWQGNLLVPALKGQHLNRIIIDKQHHAVDEVRSLRSIQARLRHIIESPEGWLYIATDDGRILLIKPTKTIDNESLQ